MAIVANPGNGPGTSKSTTYATYIANMQGAGIKVLGVVYTNYGLLNNTVTVAQAEALIDSWYSWYNVDGIMLAQMDDTNNSTNAGYYSTLMTYIHGKKANQLVVGDPGNSSAIPAVYVGTVDVIIGYSGAGEPSPSALQAVTTTVGGTASQWGMFAYAQSTAPTSSYITSIAGYVSWIFVTDASESNAFSTVPSYQSTELTNLQIVDAPSGGGGGGGGGGSQYVPPASTTNTRGKYTVKVAGSEVDLYESIDFENSLDLQVNKAEIQFPDSSTLLASEGIGKDIQILRDGVLIWRGLGVSNSKIYNMNGRKQYNLNCLSNKIYLQNTTFTKPAGVPVVTYGGAIGKLTAPPQPPLTSATSIFNDILVSQGGASAAVPSIGYLVPLYIYPGSAWTDLINQKNANPTVPIIAIMNPGNGPGPSIDTTYQSYVRQLQTAGIRVIGYVATDWAALYGTTISIANAEGQIDDYYNWYGVDGIFLDEMDNTNTGSDATTYYQVLTNYVHGKPASGISAAGAGIVIGNPGTTTIAAYIGCVDVMTPYESGGLPSVTTVQTDTIGLGGTASQWGIFAYQQSSAPTTNYLTTLQGSIAWIFSTDACIGSTVPPCNPYDVEPSYAATTVTNLAQTVTTGSSSSSNVLVQGAVGTSNIPHAALIIIRQTAIQTLSQLISASLWEARVNPDNTVDFGSNSDGTVGRSTSVFTFQEGENLMKTEVDYGIDKLVNQVTICGNGTSAVSASGQVSVTAKNTSSIATNGTWSKILTLPNCVDQNLLQAYANALLDDLNSPIYTVNAQLADLSSGVPFTMGDTVTVNETSFGLNNALFRVISEHRHYDGQQGEVVNVVLAQNYRMVNVTHFKLKRLEDILNSQMQNQQVFNNSYNPASTSAAIGLVVNAPQISNGIPNSGGSLETYAVISVSGINAGVTFSITPSEASGAVLTQSYIIDTFNGKQYAIGPSSPTSGTQYTLFTTDDIYDHIIAFQVNASSGSTSTITVVGNISLTPPTIPT